MATVRRHLRMAVKSFLCLRCRGELAAFLAQRGRPRASRRCTSRSRIAPGATSCIVGSASRSNFRGGESGIKYCEFMSLDRRISVAPMMDWTDDVKKCS